MIDYTQAKTTSDYRTVVHLAFDKYREEQSASPENHIMSAEFKQFAISQMKVFILAGHDTTSATLCYVFYLLSCNPSALQHVQAEHDQVFGSDLSQTVVRSSTSVMI